MSASKTEWIAVDWGTTNLRAWLFDAAGEIIAERSSGDGMGRLSPEAFEPKLLTLVGEYLSDDDVVHVIACGMVGARQGWAEAPYAAVPCAPPGIERAKAAPSRDPRLQVRILPGVSQAAPADVMRGEETQIAGFLALNPGFEGAICLPGTHTKWVRVGAGEIASFRTFMTGELFALLGAQSLLRHSFSGEEWDDVAFLDAVTDAMAAPEMVTADLFSIRAAGLLHGLSGAAARARLSGLLFGVELAGARPYWAGRKVALVGSEALCRLYEKALAEHGVTTQRADADAITLAGLKAAYEESKGKKS